MNDLREAMVRDLDAVFPELVRRLQTDVHSGLRRMYGADGEDLTQETFIRAYRALRGYDADRIRSLEVRGWIWTIALNLGRNHARDRARRPMPVEVLESDGASDPEPPDSVAWDRRLSALPAAQRKAVVLRHVVGLSYAEISLAVERPEGTVKADVHRGIERLRRIIAEEET